MIKFVKNEDLDVSMNFLLISMMDMDHYLSEILDFIGKELTPQKEKELINILKKYNIPYDNLYCDSKILTENPYYKNIKLNDINHNSVKYEKDIIKKRTLINMNFHKKLGRYLFHYHPIGYFDEDIIMPVLKEGDKVWMSPAVSEFLSMSDGINKGHGKCLTLGLGIGVIPYLWSLKDDVESITIVEVNKDVIDLFEECIKPQFNTDKEIEIINGNAFDYYNKEFLDNFDYVYVDFWESSEDGLKSYIKLMEKKVNYHNINYWIEDSILCDVKYLVVMYLYNIYIGKNIYDFISSLDPESQIIAKKINRYFKNSSDVISTENDLLDIIHSKYILRKILSI